MPLSSAARCHRPRRRKARGLAAFFALMLVVSNALAAIGLCIVKAPHPAQDAQAFAAALMAAGDAADLLPACADHALAAADVPAAPDAVSAHCTQDDPVAQVRANDVPSAALDAVPVFMRVVLAPLPLADGPVRAADSRYAPPLYARLSRLLL